MSWRSLWLRYVGTTPFGRFAARMAGLFLPPYYGRISLSQMHPKGYISPDANVSHTSFSAGKNVFIDDRVLIYQDEAGGPVAFGNAVQIYHGTILQTGQGGSISVGNRTHIQPRCQLSAYKAPIVIGQRVDIAPYCAFYPYSHGMRAGEIIRRQPLQSRGGIIIEDDAWLGVGVTVLDGVRIGQGTVVGAGAVVTKNLPANSICSGVPARVMKMRDNHENMAQNE